MTTFEQPDCGLLVEHLLPSLLGGSYSPSQEPQERALFFGELGMALEELLGRLTVISSRPRTTQEDSQYPWLWRYVSHFIVGAESRAVQHAKLWAFHWKVSDEDYIELHVSSTNLTTSAFKAQMQAGWQMRLRLGGRPSRNMRATWGNLITFLDALGVSAGTVAATRTKRLVALLGRAECPSDLTFIASMPGRKFAARQLKQFEPSEFHILTPTIGEWNDRTLAAWSADAGIIPSKIHLKWIPDRHPWADRSGWTLSTTALKTLKGIGIRLQCIPVEARFTEQHHEADERWSHAKLYLLRSRRKQLLLVTSANWSRAAWGAGSEAPQNFELGVIFEVKWNELEALGEPFDPPNTSPFCLDRIDDEDDQSTLQWAEASWDAKRIRLHVRSCNATTPITALISFAGSSPIDIAVVDGAAVVPWKTAEHTPLTARFAQGTEVLAVDVLDLRSPAEFAKTPLPEVDPAVAQSLRRAFLLQRYGGRDVDLETIFGLSASGRPLAATPPAADYSVQAWLDARAAFNVVDQWRAALKRAAGDPLLFERVCLDGKELQTLYADRAGPAAVLVSEEISRRLDKDT